ncbi:methylated-DNA--[protein]-cysteine S-methyltransferase [Thiococcus pfennigii]|jgi:methylated-DNA-[protein]-cysteine S-methyltransferase|uniref:methylated-DNA--[protein]-cysteine S-methyltransferase n=1 Tax=Thiococcus pfennigii TaxID=1057 RepID=UPI00190546BF|nr:methylated-DNA--[protein]-cysteine S-methyltransferase [Thiococcus pfennigii]MBK1730532.1 cysteine methyltransferase [Thiococcus pfennigii]
MIAISTTPFGPIGIDWRDGALVRVDLAPEVPPGADGGPMAAPPERVQRAFATYFADPRVPLALPLRLAGSDFQRRVWAALREIPAGQTRTYGELARALGTGARAIGLACRANPCPIAIPCHRVVAVRGLGGFAGAMGGRKLAIKRWLLAHEGAVPAP